MTDESIFDAALALPNPAERAAYLDRACVDKPDLRQEIEELLRAHGQHDNPLDRPPLESTGAFEEARVSAGRVFAGKYKLRQKLGAGGMGEVWVADQLEPVQRRVAIKVIRPGMDSARLLARFEQERQALALMDHPNVAKVLDAGIDDGRPYFVMELIKGLPITKYCDEAKLNPRQRLELFVPVCQAVQHAHQKGIIHRDLKPSNVIVGLYDARPVPKVIDFGVAKATGPRLSEHSIFTEVGSLIGTLEYMSPEQAELNNLDIDTRSDIYALGILLYELLTGTVPFTRKQLESAAFTEMLRIIKEAEPPKPSTKLSGSATLPAVAAVRQMEPKKLTALMRGELDWIVMKAIEKDRSRRYETANGFAMDVQRYLSGETVQAVPPGSVYRFKKFVQRNRRAVTAASLVLLTLLAGMIGTTIGIFEARRQAQLARNEAEAREQARLDEEMQRTKAEAARDRVATVLDAMTSDITGDSIATQKEITEEQKKFLAQVLTYYKELADENADDEKTRARAARAAVRVTKIEYRFLRGDEAIAANRIAIDRHTALVADFPSVVAYREELAKAHQFQAYMLTDHAANHTDAHRHNLAAYAILQKLVDEFPAEPRFRSDLVGVHSNLSLGFYRLGMRSKSEEHEKQSLALLEYLVAEFTAKQGCEAELAQSLQGLGASLIGTERSSEGEQMLRKALAIRQQLVASNPTAIEQRSQLSNLQRGFGSLLISLGKPQEAEENLRAALAIGATLAADFPNEPTFKSGVAGNHTALGDVLKKLKRPTEADEQYRKAIAIREKLVADLPKRSHYRWLLGRLYNTFGSFVRDTGKPEDSLAWYDKAIRTLAPIVQEKPQSVLSIQDTVASHRNRAQILSRLNKRAEALTDWNRIVELSDKEALPSARAYRAYARVMAGETDAALAESNELLVGQKWSPVEWYNFACVFAIASGKIAAKKAEYADRAMELLRQSVTAGYKNAAHMKTDADMVNLRDRDDFKKLIAELEAKK